MQTNRLTATVGKEQCALDFDTEAALRRDIGQMLDDLVGTEWKLVDTREYQSAIPSRSAFAPQVAHSTAKGDDVGASRGGE